MKKKDKTQLEKRTGKESVVKNFQERNKNNAYNNSTIVITLSHQTTADECEELN